MDSRTTRAVQKTTASEVDRMATRYGYKQQKMLDIVLTRGLKLLNKIGLDEFLKLGKEGG